MHSNPLFLIPLGKRLVGKSPFGRRSGQSARPEAFVVGSRQTKSRHW